jgi:hypothetical protein
MMSRAHGRNSAPASVRLTLRGVRCRRTASSDASRRRMACESEGVAIASHGCACEVQLLGDRDEGSHLGERGHTL